MAYVRRNNGSEFDRTKPTSQHLKDVARSFLKAIEKKYQTNENGILEMWPHIVAKDFAQASRAKKFEDGKLFIAVKNSMALSLMNTVETKKSIIEAYRKMAPEIQVREIYFRIGV